MLKISNVTRAEIFHYITRRDKIYLREHYKEKFQLIHELTYQKSILL